ncbi:MAG: hypothetical protein J7M19_07400 [Planctomycetes bacterium]|nr:hypothetical protein [Planctomycetota bacterium]
MSLPHSASRGFGRDAETGSWLAILGNPTGPSLSGLPEEAASQLLKRYQRDGRCAVTELNAPFVVVICDAPAHAVHIVTDRGGLQRLYLCRSQGAHVLCTSSLVLAAEVPVHINPDAVATYFQAGHLLGEATLYTEMRKIGPAVWLTLSDGKEDEEMYWRPPAAAPGGGLTGWADRLVDSGLEAAERALSANVETTVEVTGGLDSRFNLACALKTGRPFAGWTISDVLGKDVEVAERLAEAHPFDHILTSPLDDLAWNFEADVHRIHLLTDGETDCLNVIASPSANRQLAGRRKQSITGIGGELFRGHYYRSLGGLSRDIRIARLLGWQLCLNTGYHHDIFTPQFSDPSSRRLRSVVAGLLEETEDRSGTWRADYFHYRGSMQAAAGRSMTFNNFFYRQAAPYCTNRSLDLAFSIPAAFKKRSLVVRRALQRLDSVFADIPLDRGLPARPLGIGDFPAVATLLWRYAGKARRRILAKYLRTSNTKKIASSLQTLVDERLGCLCENMLNPDNMASLALYDRGRLAEFVERNRNTGFPDRTQMGLILSMEMTSRYVGGSLRMP